MEVFACQACGQVLYFENVLCERCGHALGYLPDQATISALEPADENWAALAAQGAPYRYCKNYNSGVCNWMLPVASGESLCAACRHNRTIPDLTVPNNLELWRKLEAAKHRLFYSLLKLGLPLQNQTDNPERGLAFEFLSEAQAPHGQQVMTGHDNGVITLALDEADDAKREEVRAKMGEPYRTLLGHFRHEVGHYYWNILVRDAASSKPSGQSSAGRTRTTAPPCRPTTQTGRPPTGNSTSSRPTRARIRGKISRRRGPTICTSWTRWRRRGRSASRCGRALIRA